MARKELGYVELEWTCPNCKTRNPGLTKTCQSCGAPQPVDVSFQSKADEQLITDEDKLKQAQKGPDIHCGFCGARNPADAVICSQCGGDLKQGKARESGKVMGEFKTGTETKTKCPNCATENPANAQICVKCGAPLNAALKPEEAPKKGLSLGCLIALGIAGLLAIIGIISLISMGAKRSDMVGSLSNAKWERIISIEEYGPVQKQDWRDMVPSNAQMGDCYDKVRDTSDSPSGNSVEVCGEPYTVDKGNGVAEVVQDCHYDIYDSYCTFTVDEWHSGTDQIAEGSGLNASWPSADLDATHRESSRTERYTLYFSANGKDYSYQTSDFQLYQRAQPGTRWKITVNGFGSVVSLEPAN
ncbi:MAG: zinc-ribbon domain-containing protein [Leptolinea sp.]|jgi:ribosomal protein L40E|nr:zinc-ribbon domain-containing protein [Leptolinea sp.]